MTTTLNCSNPVSSQTSLCVCEDCITIQFPEPANTLLFHLYFSLNWKQGRQKGKMTMGGIHKNEQDLMQNHKCSIWNSHTMWEPSTRCLLIYIIVWLVQNFELKNWLQRPYLSHIQLPQKCYNNHSKATSTITFTGTPHLYDQSHQWIRHVMLLGKIVSTYPHTL
jgi:hypothetical protein